MRYTKFCFSMLACMLLFAADLSAQEGRGGQGRRGDRPERRARPFGPGRPERSLEKLKQEVTLTDEQAKQADAYFAKYGEQMKLLREENRPSPERLEQLREIREGMNAAREAKDEARVQELIAQMRTMREQDDARMAPVIEQSKIAQKELKDSLLAILKPEQKPRFERFWSQEFEGKGRMRVPAVEPRLLKSLVDDLSGVNSEQKEKIEQAFRTYQEASRKGELKDGEKVALERSLAEDVFAVLTPEQTQTLEREIRERDRKSRREKARGEDKGEESQP